LVLPGAADAAPKPKKHKKSEDVAGSKRPSVKEINGITKPSDGAPKAKSSRKRAEDKMSVDASASNEAAKEKNTKKKAKSTVEANGGADGTAEKPKKITKKKSAADMASAPETMVEAPKEQLRKSRKAKGRESGAADEDIPVISDSKKSKKSKRAAKESGGPKESSPEVAIEGQIEEEAEEDSENDQTAALLAGFESEGDESDLEKEEHFTEDQLKKNVPKGLMNKLKKISDKKDEPGVVFVGYAIQISYRDPSC
jgi:nucleolar protein 15